jgi:hypothetical protein
VSTFAQFHAKNECSNRSIVCAECILPNDEKLGFSHSSRPCARCGRSIETGVVVMQPRTIKRSKK